MAIAESWPQMNLFSGPEPAKSIDKLFDGQMKYFLTRAEKLYKLYRKNGETSFFNF